MRRQDAGRQIVRISSSDEGFYSDSDCGTWSRRTGSTLATPAAAGGRVSGGGRDFTSNRSPHHRPQSSDVPGEVRFALALSVRTSSQSVRPILSRPLSKTKLAAGAKVPLRPPAFRPTAAAGQNLPWLIIASPPPIRPTSRGRCAAMRWGRGGSAPWPWKWTPATASSPRCRWCRSRRCRIRNRRR